MSAKITGLNHVILRPLIQTGKSLLRGRLKKLQWLVALFLLLAAVAIHIWLVGEGHWTFDKGLSPVAADAFDIGAKSWDRLTAPIPEVPSTNTLTISEAYGKLPLSFEINEGQTDSSAKFLARGPGYGLFLTSTEVMLTLHKSKDAQVPPLQQHLAGVKNRRPASAEQAQTISEEPPVALHLKLVGTNSNPEVIGIDEFPGKVNYFRGNDPKHWRTHIPPYGKVKYAQVYPGIDLAYYGNPQQLEHDFVIAPRANPSMIAIEITGTSKASIDAKGDLVLANEAGEIRCRKFLVYQETNGVRQNIGGSYVLTAGQRVGFQVGAYEATRPLVIDPVLVYSTYLGGSYNDMNFGLGNGIAVDPTGNAYVTGITYSFDFPGASSSPIQSRFGGESDAFVTKISRWKTLMAEVLSAPNSCPRPTDQYGPRYQIITGAYQSRGETTGGGKFVTIMMDRAAPISVSVTGEVFDVAGNIPAGTRITLVGYVSNSMSGAQSLYSCIELA